MSIISLNYNEIITTAFICSMLCYYIYIYIYIYIYVYIYNIINKIQTHIDPNMCVLFQKYIFPCYRYSASCRNTLFVMHTAITIINRSFVTAVVYMGEQMYYKKTDIHPC